MSSGTAALAVALKALKSQQPQRTEVVIPAYTRLSVPAAVVRAGLTPVLCDINPATFDLDESGLERAIGPNTLAVVAHHLFGIASDIERVRAVRAARHRRGRGRGPGDGHRGERPFLGLGRSVYPRTDKVKRLSAVCDARGGGRAASSRTAGP